MWDAEGRYYPNQPLLQNYPKTESQYPEKKQFRKCNDLFFAILFLLVMATMFAILAVGFAKGDPSKLVGSQSVEDSLEGRADLWFQDAVAQAKDDPLLLLLAAPFALFAAFTWLSLLKKFTRLFVFGSLLIGLATLLTLGVYFLVHSWRGFSKFGSPQILGTSFLVGALLIGLTLLWNRKRINTTCILIQEGCKGIEERFSVVLVTLLMGGAITVFGGIWILGMLYLYTVPIESLSPSSSPLLPHFDITMRKLMLFELFAFFWFSAFLSAVLRVSVSGGIANWYSEKVGSSFSSPPTSTFIALRGAVTTNLGSLAFGALLEGICDFILFLLRRIKSITKGQRCLLAILTCLFASLQSLIKFINRWAYSIIAMEGLSYLGAASRAFDLFSRNLLLSLLSDLILRWVQIGGEIIVASSTVGLCIVVAHLLGRTLPWLTLTIIALSSFGLIHFLSVTIESAVTTLLLSYAIHVENDPTIPPISNSLHRIIQEKAVASVKKDEY